MKPILINNLDIAKNQQKTSGEIDASHLDRLAGLLANEGLVNQTVSYSLMGHEQKLQTPSLTLTIDTVLMMICQRCLEQMQLDLSLTYEYVISVSEPEGFEGDDAVDWLEISREMNLHTLIEDELLMAIPLAPTHAHNCKPLKTESGEKHNPFATLKELKKVKT